jgi:hypothetical protein
MRPRQFTEEWGYLTRVGVVSGGTDQPKKMVSLVLGEMARIMSLSISEVAWSNLTPQEARALAEELKDAAYKAESMLDD